MNYSICKKLLSGFVILILLFATGIFQEALAGPILKITRNNANPIEKAIEFAVNNENPGIFELIEVFVVEGVYMFTVEEEDGDVHKGDDFFIPRPNTRVRFTFNSETNAYKCAKIPIPEPSTMILIGSLLIGFVGVKKGQKLS